MNSERRSELRKMTLKQRRDLKERLIAQLACAAYGADALTEFVVLDRPAPPETHDFDAKRVNGEHLLAIEVTEFHASKNDETIFNPEKHAFWQKLICTIESNLKGKMPGIFLIHGGHGQIPRILQKERKTWLEHAEATILATARYLPLGEKRPLGPPLDITEMTLEKCSDAGSQVQFFSTPSGVADVIQMTSDALKYFIEETLSEKNRGSLAKAKLQGKTTVLAVVMEYIVGRRETLIAEMRRQHEERHINNIDHAYLIDLSVSSELQTMVIRVF